MVLSVRIVGIFLSMFEGSNTIIIFTKDRPEVLFETLRNFKSSPFHIIVFDDSCKISNITEYKNNLKGFHNVTYHGQNEQKKVLSHYNLSKDELKPFINKLGVKEWNLGNARNYALLLSKILGLRKVLFMDDDISIENASLISSIFKKLDHYDFVGSKVVGMIDDSVIGHIVRKLKIPPEEYFSGGFIGFRTASVHEYFMNEYNEDWIWLYLHELDSKLLSYGKVYQQTFDPFSRGSVKAISQEFGELLVDGVKEAIQAKNVSLLQNHKLWEQICNEKIEYYAIISECANKTASSEMQLIVRDVAEHSKGIKSGLLLKAFNHYFEQRKKWQSIISKINSQNMDEQKIKYSSADGLQLTGIVATPSKPKAFALMAHGITMHKDEWNNLHFRIAKDLYEKDIASLRFDYRGHGESDGKMRDMTVVGEIMDVKGSMKEVEKRWKKKTAFVASSFGAGSSILYAALNPEKVSCLVLLNPVIDYDATFLNPQVDWGKESFNKKGFKNLEQKGYLLLDEEHQLDAKLLMEFQLIKPYEYLQKIKCPVLTIHGDCDSMVPFKISKKYGSPNRKSHFVKIKDAEHGFVNWDDEEGNSERSMENQKYVTQLLIEWIEKWS